MMDHRMKKIGILGGTFNPIHTGHLAIANVALDGLNLDKVLFIPSYLPPHKTSANVVSAEHRLNMVKLAMAGHPAFEVLDFEIKQKGKSYSYKTVRHLKSIFPKGTEFYFIIGEDSFLTLNTWKRIDELLSQVQFVVINRPGSRKTKSKIKVLTLTMPGLDISSSLIRKKIISRQSARYFLPDCVLTYIEKNKLYLS